MVIHNSRRAGPVLALAGVLCGAPGTIASPHGCGESEGNFSSANSSPHGPEEQCSPPVAEFAGGGAQQAVLNLLPNIRAIRGNTRAGPASGAVVKWTPASTGGAAGGDGSSLADSGRLSGFLIHDYSELDREQTQIGGGFELDNNVTILGADYRVRPDLFAGMTVTYSDADTDLDNNSGDSQIDSIILGAHASKNWDSGAFVDTLVTYGELSVDIERFDGTTLYDASTDGRLWSAEVSAGKTYYRGPWRLTPIGKLTYARGYIEGYDETASTNFGAAQSVDRNRIGGTTLNLSLQTDYVMLADWGVVIPSLKVAYQREFSAANDITGNLSFGGVPGGAFFSQIEDPDRNVTIVTAGASAQFQHGLSAFLSYEELFEHTYIDRYNAVIGARLELP